MKINGQIRYQTVIGFGGAFTDAAGINIDSLSQPTRDALMQSYFGINGSKTLNFFSLKILFLVAATELDKSLDISRVVVVRLRYSVTNPKTFLSKGENGVLDAPRRRLSNLKSNV